MTRIGVALSGGLSPRDIVECVTLAEDVGYESAWVAEGHGGDQFAILAACATKTHRIRLGTAISSVFVRTAPTIAMAAATVDEISGGRFILGLGSSHRVQVEGEHGLPYGQPIQRVRETVDIVRALLRDGVVTYEGRLINIKRYDLWFTPLRGEIPIYLSAVFPTMLEVCGELAQGALLAWPTVDAAARAAEHVARGARRAGRASETIDIAASVSCHVAASRQEARDRMRPGVAFYAGSFPRYNRLLAERGFPEATEAIKVAWDRGDREGAARLVPDALVDSVALLGTPADCRERLEAYRQAGLALPIIRLSVGKEAAMAAIRACAP